MNVLNKIIGKAPNDRKYKENKQQKLKPLTCSELSATKNKEKTYYGILYEQFIQQMAPPDEVIFVGRTYKGYIKCTYEEALHNLQNMNHIEARMKEIENQASKQKADSSEYNKIVYTYSVLKKSRNEALLNEYIGLIHSKKVELYKNELEFKEAIRVKGIPLTMPAEFWE